MSAIKWFIMISTLAGPPLQAACQKPFKLVVEDWAPYSFFAQDGKPSGMDIEMIQAIFRKAVCEVVLLRDIPRKRRHKMFEMGQLDLLYAASDTPERHAIAWYSKPYRQEQISVFSLTTKQDNIKQLDDILQLPGALLAPNTGWYGEGYARLQARMLAAGRWYGYEDYEQGVRMLVAGRGEYLMGDHEALLHTARQSYGLKLKQIGPVVNLNPVHLMFSKRSVSPADVMAINNAIAVLQADGTLKAIRVRYGR